MALRSGGASLDRARRAVLSGIRKKWMTSQAALAAGEAEVVYSGGFDRALRILKRVSVFSCACTVFGVPLLAVTSTNPRMSPVQRGALAFVVVSFGVGTTLALHVVVKPYVVRLLRHPLDGTFTAEKMNAFGGLKTTQLNLSRISKPRRAWASFECDGESYFMEESPGCYSNEEFRKTLWLTIKQAKA